MNNGNRRERIRQSAERTAKVSAGLNERLAADERRETHNHPAGYGCTPRCVVPSDHDTDQCECDDRRERCSEDRRGQACHPLHADDCQYVDTDDRRERYAAAIIEPDGVIWEMLTDDEKFAEYARADAAMALADAEFASFDAWAKRVEDENNRLRAELETTHKRGSDTIEHLCGEVNRLRTELRRSLVASEASERALQEQIDGQAKEIDRLRAELTRSQADEVERRIEAGKLRATLARVRGVLDGKAEEPDSPEFIEGYNLALSNIRAALDEAEGEQ